VARKYSAEHFQYSYLIFGTTEQKLDMIQVLQRLKFTEQIQNLKNTGYSGHPLLVTHESHAVVHEGTREWARWNRETTGNPPVAAPLLLGRRKMAGVELQRRRREAHGAVALQREREETGRTTSTSSSPRTRW
jgi:hypothetical protein